jgi:dihydrofolate reductase
MAKLLYGTSTSLDGFIEDVDGNFDFTVPTPEVHQFFNDVYRPVGTHISGRRLYETMAVWETMDFEHPPEDQPEELAALKPQGIDFQQIWRGADKIVYSTTLEEVWTPRTELRSEFDVDEVRELKESASADILIGGATLAQTAFAAGLIDEVHLTLAPATLGAGKPALPTDLKLDLELIDQRRFDNGSVNLQYRVV